MTTSRRTRKNISKEQMFNKIMPSYLSNTYNTDYNAYQQGNEGRNPKSEPDTFKIREKVLAAMEDRPLVPEAGQFAQQPAAPEYPQNQTQQQSPYYSPAQQQMPQQNPFYTGSAQQMQQFQYQQPQQQYAAPVAPVTDDKPRYINITEEILYSKLTNMIAMFKCCNCEKCRQTIMLHVLNSVKPEYVYKKPSEVKEMIESNNYVDINQPIIRAILDTKSNPPHKK